MWTWALTNVPWKSILLHAPTIVEAARTFYATTRKPAGEAAPSPRAGDGLEGLRRAVEELEARETQQAALFADLAKQVQEMATALEVLRARVLFALVGASLALVVALVTAAVLVWR